MDIKQLTEELDKVLNEAVDYLVSLNKVEVENGELQWSEYDNSEETDKKEAISKAKEFISAYANTEDFWIVTVEKGIINWEYRSSYFGNGDYVYAITNKDSETTFNLLGDSAVWEYGKLEFLK